MDDQHDMYARREAVLRLLRGDAPEDVLRDTGMSAPGVDDWKCAFEAAGAGALGDQRRLAAVMRLHRSGDLEGIASEFDVPPARLAEWRETFLEAGTSTLIAGGARVYVISGPSLSGKTTLLNMAKGDPQLSAVGITKYSTRERRGADDDVVHVEVVRDPQYDFVYAYNDQRYGLRIEDIGRPIVSGQNGFVVVTPIRVVRQIKQHFGELAVSLYLFRPTSDRQFAAAMADRMAASPPDISSNGWRTVIQEIETRVSNARSALRLYVENIHEFDHVILNAGEPGEMLAQVRNLVRHHAGKEVA